MLDQNVKKIAVLPHDVNEVKILHIFFLKSFTGFDSFFFFLSIPLLALEMLMKVTDVGEDWRVDPILRKACKPVVDVACSDTDGGDARVMSCLKDKIGTKYMKPDCELALKQINYFVVRNFKLDPQLYRQCKEDAIRICHAKNSWADVNIADQMDPDREPLILPCLYRYAYSTENRVHLKPSCLQV